MPCPLSKSLTEKLIPWFNDVPWLSLSRTPASSQSATACTRKHCIRKNTAEQIRVLQAIITRTDLRTSIQPKFNLFHPQEFGQTVTPNTITIMAARETVCFFVAFWYCCKATLKQWQHLPFRSSFRYWASNKSICPGSQGRSTDLSTTVQSDGAEISWMQLLPKWSKKLQLVLVVDAAVVGLLFPFWTHRNTPSLLLSCCRWSTGHINGLNRWRKSCFSWLLEEKLWRHWDFTSLKVICLNKICSSYIVTCGWQLLKLSPFQKRPHDSHITLLRSRSAALASRNSNWA